MTVRERRDWRGSVALALLWRSACHAVMLGLSLLTEGRPAPHLPDLVLDHLPRVAWIADHNWWLWVACYIPPALLLWRRDRSAFLRFLYLGGIVSILRGLCVGMTGLGPPDGPDVNAGTEMNGPALFHSWIVLINPFSTLFGNAARVYLTKDLFFSGHASSTFLLWLYCRGKGWLGPVALAGHLVTVAIVLLAHLHYTIDIVGAWAITYSVYALAERRWPGKPA